VDEGRWEAYEARTGISKDTYARRLLKAARYRFQEDPWEGDFDEHGVAHRHGRGGLPDGKVESVEMDGQGSDTSLVVLFRLNEYPGDLFGWRIPTGSAPHNDDNGSPEDWALFMPMELEETIYGSPRSAWSSEPDERGIFWIRLFAEGT
jgi:hypothetical protein